MKKLLFLTLVSFTIFTSCKQPSTNDAGVQASTTATEDSLSGTFTSKDKKSVKLLTNIRLFAVQDTSYVNDITPDFTLKNLGDTAVIVRGHQELLAYHKNFYSLFTDLSFTDGNTFTYVIKNGDVWSAYFGEFIATGKFSKKKYVMPVSIWVRWNGDKVVHQTDMVDSKFVNEELAASKK